MYIADISKKGCVRGKLFIIVAILALVFSFIIPIGKSYNSLNTITIGNSVYAQGIEDYTCDGVADDVQFQQALDALPSIGGKLLFRAGNYVFTQTVSRAINNVTIEGIGDASYISCNNSLPLFSASGQTGWTFSNFRTDAGWIVAGINTTFINMNNNGAKIMIVNGVDLSNSSPSSKWYSGSGMPSGNIGVDGDYYLDGSNGFAYTKNNNIWNYVNSIKGATGATGEQGIQGIKGDTGNQGIQGIQGEIGPNQVTTSTATSITGFIKGNGTNVSASTANVSILEAVTEAFTTALKLSYDTAVTNSHTHSNKSTLDAITEAFTTSLKNTYDGLVANNHTHSNKSTLDATQEAFTTALKSSYDSAVSISHSNTNDPTADQKSALAGTSGSPSSTNKYVTDADTRNTNARTPTTHTHLESDVTNLTTDLNSKLSTVTGTALDDVFSSNGLLKRTGIGTYTVDSNAYITGNQNISLTGAVTGNGTTSIATALTGSGLDNIFSSNGLLKRTGATTYTVDTNNYITGNQNISLSGDLAGSGTTSISGTVTGIQGKAITLATGFLKYNGSSWTSDTNTYLTGNQNISLSGDLSGSGATSISGTVTGIQGKAITLATGFLKYSGSAWAFDSNTYMANPMTTLGDIVYENNTPAPARLGGNTNNSKYFLTSTASSGVAQAPAWGTLVDADIPTTLANHTLTTPIIATFYQASGQGLITVPASASAQTLATLQATQTFGSGSTWNGAVVTGTYGGSGVNNGSTTFTRAGNVAFSGTYNFTGTLSNTTTVTFPTSGTLFSTATEIPNTNIPCGINNGTASSAQSQATVAGTYYYITNSALTMPASAIAGMKVGTRFVWDIAMTKTAAGTGTFIIAIYRGTNGTTSDTRDVSQSIGTQIAVVDNMHLRIQITIVTTGATGSYFWTIIPDNKAVTATGFGVATGTGAYFSGTVSSVALNTASLKFGIGFESTTGTPTIVIPMVSAQAFNMD